MVPPEGISAMSNYYPQRIGKAGVDFEGVYEFYQRLERRERAACLWKIAMAVSVPVVLTVSSYLGTHYVNWTPLTASVQQVL